MKPTQTSVIKATLLSGQSITSVDAFENYQITRLAPIIKRLRERGWPISGTRQKGNGIAIYSVPENWRPTDIKKP